MKPLKSLLFLLLFALSAYSQDQFVGSWSMEYPAEKNNPSIKANLQIGNPERNLLYPAQLSISSDNFSATYELLLVKKSGRKLFISRNKYPLSETPFSLGNWTIFLNGTIDFTKDLKGNQILTINRIVANKYGIDIPGPKTIPSPYQPLAGNLYDFLKAADIQFKKSTNNAWDDTLAAKILQPRLSSAYFGVLDTIEVKTKDGIVKFEDNNDIDIISVLINGSPIADEVDSKKKRDPEEFILDTGINIISFFADDYGKNPPATAAVNIEFGDVSRRLDFKNKENIAANFIVLKVAYEYDPKKEKKFQLFTDSKDEPLPVYPNNPGAYKHSNEDLKKPTRLLGNIITENEQITLALWDDAVEDGDSISININGKWITQGFPVKKKPQFIKVSLQPGQNIITFVADNLGSIIPNTSVLEIIDGMKRQSFNIETDMNQNNRVKILYDFKR